VQFKGKAPLQYSWFSHEQFNDEAMQRVQRYDEIARRAQAIGEHLPPPARTRSSSWCSIRCGVPA